MKFQTTKLSGSNISELETEIRYYVATARADGAQLIRFDLTHFGSEKEDSRIMSCATRVLRRIKNERIIQFFLPKTSVGGVGAESDYLLNKYYDFVTAEDAGDSSVFVKM